MSSALERAARCRRRARVDQALALVILGAAAVTVGVAVWVFTVDAVKGLLVVGSAAVLVVSGLVGLGSARDHRVAARVWARVARWEARS